MKKYFLGFFAKFEYFLHRRDFMANYTKKGYFSLSFNNKLYPIVIFSHVYHKLDQ